MTPFPLLATAALLKISSTEAAFATASSLNKKTVGVYLWKTSSMALSLNGRTFGTELVSTKDFKESAVNPTAKSSLFSSKVLNKTTDPSAALFSAPTEAGACAKVISS